MEEQLHSSWNKLINKLSSWVDTVVLNLPNFLIAVLIFVVAFWLSRNLQGWANRLLKKVIQHASIRSLISNVLSIIVVFLGIILALSVLHLDGTLQSLLAGAGVAGLAISLALQGTLSNTFSGIFIAIKDEINIGDWVETNGFSGRVVEIDLRNTKVKEADNNIVVIPNKMILDNPLKNYGLTRRIRCTITCGVSYDADLERVQDIAMDEIRKTFSAADHEQPEFYYTNFGGSSIDFMLRFWTNAKANLTALQVKSKAIIAIKKAFDENNIEIPFPIRTIVYDGAEEGSEQAVENEKLSV